MYLIGFERLPCERIMPPSCWLCGVWAVQIDQFVLAANLLRRQCVELTKKNLLQICLKNFQKQRWFGGTYKESVLKNFKSTKFLHKRRVLHFMQWMDVYVSMCVPYVHVIDRKYILILQIFRNVEFISTWLQFFITAAEYTRY